jgi:hypothetical protein
MMYFHLYLNHLTLCYDLVVQTYGEKIMEPMTTNILTAFALSLFLSATASAASNQHMKLEGIEGESESAIITLQQQSGEVQTMEKDPKSKGTVEATRKVEEGTANKSKGTVEATRKVEEGSY